MKFFYILCILFTVLYSNNDVCDPNKYKYIKIVKFTYMWQGTMRDKIQYKIKKDTKIYNVRKGNKLINELFKKEHTIIYNFQEFKDKGKGGFLNNLFDHTMTLWIDYECL